MQIGQLMVRNDRSIGMRATITEAIEYMQEIGASAVPVCGPDGSVRGVLSSQRCDENSRADPDTTPIRSLLRGKLGVVDIDTSPEDALQIMSERRTSWLVVQESGLLAGLVDRDTLAAHIDGSGSRGSRSRPAAGAAV